MTRILTLTTLFLAILALAGLGQDGTLPSASAEIPTPRLIFLEAGHGGKDPGAVHYDAEGKVDVLEKEVNLDITKRIGKLLTESGFAVAYARETDVLLTSFDGPNDRQNRRAEIQARLDAANKLKADLYFSIHFNGYRQKEVSGTEVYYCADRPFAAQSKRLAELTLQNILKELKGIGYQAVNRGAKDDLGASWPGYHYFALGPTTDRPGQMPAVIGEGLFVTNDADAAILRSEAGRQAIARAYAQAVIAYYQPSAAPTAYPSSTPIPTPTHNRRLNRLELLELEPIPRPTATPTATFQVVSSTLTPTPTSELERGDPSQPRIALTFDAGASGQPAAAILDALKAANVRATIFLTGDWIKANPALVRRLVAEGHQAANHTMTHPNLPDLTEAEIQEQLLGAARLLKEIAGVEMAPYFRPPFGARDARVWQAAAKVGYRSIYWTLDSGDWREDATSAGVRDRVLREATNGYVVVMHLGSPQTAEALPEIIKVLQAAGYRLVLVSEIE